MLVGILMWSALCIVITFAAWRHPGAARLFLGCFYIAMGLGVNGAILVGSPDLFVTIGAESGITFYRWFFRTIVSESPRLFGAIVVAYEIATGILILGTGARARAGVACAIAFLLLTAPMNDMTLPNVILAIGLAPLLWRELDHGFVLARRRALATVGGGSLRNSSTPQRGVES